MVQKNRILQRTAAGCFLALAVASVALWLLSRGCDLMVWHLPSRGWQIQMETESGHRLWLEIAVDAGRFQADEVGYLVRLPGLVIEFKSRSRLEPPGVIVGVHYLLCAPGFLLLAWLFAALSRRHRTHAISLCRHCGYDLRAHKPGEKCSECGTVIPEKPAAKES